MGINITTLRELVCLESAFDFIGHTHPDVYKEALNDWIAVGKWFEAVVTSMPEAREQALHALIAEEEQIRIIKDGTTFKFWLNCSRKGGADFRHIDPMAVAGKKELDLLLHGVCTFNAHLGILFWQVIQGVRPELPNDEATLTNKVNMEIIRLSVEGCHYCGNTPNIGRELNKAIESGNLPVAYDLEQENAVALVFGHWVRVSGCCTVETEAELCRKFRQ